jgi:hypothetical protein
MKRAILLALIAGGILHAQSKSLRGSLPATAVTIR